MEKQQAIIIQYPEVSENDNINLLEFLRMLWVERIIILLVTLIFFLSGIIYTSFVSPPQIFKSSITIYEPSTTAVQVLNDIFSFNNTKIIDANGTQILEKYTNKDNLSDRFKKTIITGNFKQYFIENTSLRENFQADKNRNFDNIIAGLLNSYEINIPNDDTVTSLVTVSIKGTLPENLLNDFLNELSTKATEYFYHKLNEEFDLAKSIKIESLNNEINEKEFILKQKFLDRISKLEETNKLRIANISEEIKTKKIISDWSKNNNIPDLELEKNIIQLEETLKRVVNNVELAYLKQQANNNIYNEDVQALYTKLNQVDKLSFPDNIALDFIQSEASSINISDKYSNKLFTIIKFTISGILFSLLISIIVIYVKNSKENLNTPSQKENV